MRADREQPLTVRQLRDGGFIVLAGDPFVRGEYATPVFACGDLDTLLLYVRVHYEAGAPRRQAAEQTADTA